MSQAEVDAIRNAHFLNSMGKPNRWRKARLKAKSEGNLPNANNLEASVTISSGQEQGKSPQPKQPSTAHRAVERGSSLFEVVKVNPDANEVKSLISFLKDDPRNTCLGLIGGRPLKTGVDPLTVLNEHVQTLADQHEQTTLKEIKGHLATGLSMALTSDNLGRAGWENQLKRVVQIRQLIGTLNSLTENTLTANSVISK